jgi:hypothetical protein
MMNQIEADLCVKLFGQDKGSPGPEAIFEYLPDWKGGSFATKSADTRATKEDKVHVLR